MLRSKLVAGGLLIGAWLAACSGAQKNDFDCPVGHADCSCNADTTCAAGLVCNDRNQCVKPSASSAGSGQGGGAGRGGASASSGSSGKASGDGGTGATSSSDGGASGDTGASGTQSSNTGGDSDEAGGESGMSGAGMPSEGGTTGSGGTTSAGDGGTSGSAGTTSGAGTSALGGQSGFAGGGTGGASVTCTEITIPAVIEQRNLDRAPNVADYVYVTNDIGVTAETDYLHLGFYGPGYGAGFDGDQIGTFTLGTGKDANYQTCARCLVVDQDSDTPDDATFFATSGMLVVAAGSDQMNGFPRATLTDATLVEVTIDEHSQLSTLVPGGRCLHLASAPVRYPPAGWTCDNANYSSGDGCDCGCGIADGDCASSNVNACDSCHCTGDDLDCEDTRVRTEDNTSCR